MKKMILTFISAILLITSCQTGFDPAEEKNTSSDNNSGAIQEETQSQNTSASDYTEENLASPTAVISDDLYENFVADGTVYINFEGSDVKVNIEGKDAITVTSEETSIGKISDTKITVKLSENTIEDEANNIDEASNGIIIQYKGEGKIKYILSGDYAGTVFIKNKKADAALVLNNASITSDNGAGPALRFSSEIRTFIVVPAGTTNTITDTRELNQTSTMYDDKKGSVYSKGSLIFTGETSTTQGGTLNIINTGYKHAVYTKDYVRIANLTLNITVKGTKGRDCIRALNAVIIDGGTINLKANGTIQDDESNGIRVDGEDADDDDMTVEYTAGAGFIIINDGNLTINTVAKGITAHWKSAKSVIGDSAYTASANKSLLCENLLKDTSLTLPDPYVTINGGTINITTTGEPYEGRTDDDPSCSPEGIEAKADLTINGGTITLNCTDDAINAGGNITINGGAIYAYSSMNDAIDSNGSKGITINGGVVVALGLTTPECAFDCDQNPLTINGGTLIGLGTSNYTAPKSGKQSAFVLSSSSLGSAGTSFAVVDQSGNPVFVYTLPSKTGDIAILSSPDIKTGTSYSVKTGVTLSGGTKFHNLYTSLPEIRGGSSSLTSISTSSSNTVYTDSSAGNTFGGQGGPGQQEGPGGFGGGPGGRR